MTLGEGSEVTTSTPSSELSEVVACAACRAPLRLGADNESACPSCGHPYRRLPWAWELLPPSSAVASDLWSVWERLQANGLVSYDADPQHNLGVGPRDDVTSFARFCDLRGRVLDVGCGPQPRPGYFDPHARGT